MSILIGPMKLHLNGHKELTSHGEVKEIKAGKLVYIPIVACTEVCVKKGDYVNAGTMIAKRNDHFEVPIFSSVSGVVKGIEDRLHTSGNQADHVVIENDFKDTFVRPFEPIDPDKASKEDLVEFMKNAGIVGCGGAGFPTYIKYRGAKGIDTVLINAVECEPYITADFRIVDDKLELLVLGTRTMQKMAGAKEAIVAIKETKKDLIPRIEEAFSSHGNIKVVTVPDQYPLGWERTLIFEIFKKRYDKLPSEIGIIVNNATTAIVFAEAMTLGRPIMEKICTISGDGIKNPSNVRVPVGVTIAEIVESLGGYAKDEVTVIGGGPMMGKALTSDEASIQNASNAITIVLPDHEEAIACLRCGRCNDHCPAGIMPVRINDAEKAGNIELITDLRADQCIECGMCTYVCPSKIEVTEGVRRAKAMLLNK